MAMKKVFETDRALLKEFGLMFMKFGPPFGAAAVGFGFWQDKLFSKCAGSTLIAVAIYAALTTFTAPILLYPFHVIFTAIGNTVQWLISLVVLSFTYFLLMTPIGLFFRLFGGDRLKIRIDREADSYWETQEPSETPAERYEKQF